MASRLRSHSSLLIDHGVPPQTSVCEMIDRGLAETFFDGASAIAEQDSEQTVKYLEHKHALCHLVSRGM